MDRFTTVYTTSMHVDSSLIKGAIAGLVVLITCVYMKRRQIHWPKWFGSLGVGIVGGGVLFVVFMVLVVGWFLEGNRLVSLYEGGEYAVAEGVVHVLHAQKFHGHDGPDIVTVGDERFEIDAFRGWPGYRRTISHGGPLREGVYARVYHHEGTILRVDVRRDTGENYGENEDSHLLKDVTSK